MNAELIKLAQEAAKRAAEAERYEVKPLVTGNNPKTPGEANKALEVEPEPAPEPTPDTSGPEATPSEPKPETSQPSTLQVAEPEPSKPPEPTTDLSSKAVRNGRLKLVAPWNLGAVKLSGNLVVDRHGLYVSEDQATGLIQEGARLGAQLEFEV